MPIHNLGGFEKGPKRKKTDAYEEPEEGKVNINGYEVPEKESYGGYEIPGGPEESPEEPAQEDEAM